MNDLALTAATQVQTPVARRGSADFQSNATGIPNSFIPEGWSRLAQRFNAGISVREVLVPKGRLMRTLVSRPFGTCPTPRPLPALKRWAIVGRPSGTGSGRISQIRMAWDYKSALREKPALRGKSALQLRIVGRPFRVSIL
jgi:hypothetical protein